MANPYPTSGQVAFTHVGRAVGVKRQSTTKYSKDTKEELFFVCFVVCILGFVIFHS